MSALHETSNEVRPSAKAGFDRYLSGLGGDPAKVTTDDDRDVMRKRAVSRVGVFGLSIGLWAALLPIGMLAAIVGGASHMPALLQFGKAMMLVVIVPLVVFLFSDFGQVLGFWPYGNKTSKSSSGDGVEN